MRFYLLIKITQVNQGSSAPHCRSKGPHSDIYNQMVFWLNKNELDPV